MLIGWQGPRVGVAAQGPDGADREGEGDGSEFRRPLLCLFGLREDPGPETLPAPCATPKWPLRAPPPPLNKPAVGKGP